MSDRLPPRRWILWLAILAGGVLLLVLVTVWLLLPWRIDGLIVEQARVIQPGESDGSRQPAELATPKRIAVTFSTREDLVQLRARLGLGWIGAQLSACHKPARSTREVVTQRAEYLADDGRVTVLPAHDDRSHYRAVFNDELIEFVNHQSVFTPALDTADLCFAVAGGSMWWGALESNTVSLTGLH